MYFNFDDRQPDIEHIDRAISWREGLLLSLVHVTQSASRALCGAGARHERPGKRMAEMRAGGERAPAVFVQPWVEFEATAAAEPGVVGSRPQPDDPHEQP
jgi:hypothetical protein